MQEEKTYAESQLDKSKRDLEIEKGASFVDDYVKLDDRMLWRIEDRGKRCRKIDGNDYPTTCWLDQDFKDAGAVYEVEYLIQDYEEEDKYDSIGIFREKRGGCEMNFKDAYGLCKGCLHFANKMETIDSFSFARGDVIKLKYSKKDHTLVFYQNGDQIGRTVKDVPDCPYSTGVAFKRCGVAIRLLSFKKTVAETAP